MFYYISYTWLKITFGKELQENLEMVPNRALGATYLPAYLPVSPQPKYSAYFSSSSKHLSAYILSKCFLGLKSNLKSLKEFKLKRDQELLMKIIVFWAEYSTAKQIEKSKIANFTKVAKKKMTRQIFNEMRTYLESIISLKKRQNFVKQKLDTATKWETLNTWRVNYKKAVIHRHQEAVADHMYKTNFMKYFYIWRDEFTKYQKLNVQDQRFQIAHERNLMKKSWDALQKYKNSQKWKKSANKAAETERYHWLAKRAFEGWCGQIDKLKQKNNLYKLLTTHNHFSIKKKVMKYFKLFADFKKKQRYNDFVVVNEIVKIRQRNVLNNWHRVYVKREAIKQLVFHSERTVKGVIMRSMVERYHYQNSVHSYLVSQRHFYIQMTAFNRLSQAVEKRKALENAKSKIRERKDFWLAKKAFMNWLRKYRIIKKNYTNYAFITIQVKNAIARDCFNSLKDFTKYRKNKRIADNYVESKLKTKLLNTFYNKCLTSEKHYDISLQIATKQIYKLKSTVLRLWLDLYQKTSSERIKVDNFIQKRQTAQKC